MDFKAELFNFTIVNSTTADNVTDEVNVSAVKISFTAPGEDLDEGKGAL